MKCKLRINSIATIRKTASIENGIMQVLKILNDDEIKAVGKTLHI